MKRLVFCILMFSLSGALAQGRVIAHVGGKPLLESELKGSRDSKRASELRERVVVPAIKAYLEPHRLQLMPTDQELKRFAQLEREESKCRGESEPADDGGHHAMWMMSHLKLQRFIYERHGGGRLRFQQMGTEAFDATRQMVLDLERSGAFAIHDVQLRAMALDYWIEPNGPLMPDPGLDKAFKIEHDFAPCPVR